MRTSIRIVGVSNQKSSWLLLCQVLDDEYFDDIITYRLKKSLPFMARYLLKAYKVIGDSMYLGDCLNQLIGEYGYAKIVAGKKVSSIRPIEFVFGDDGVRPVTSKQSSTEEF
jgi:hypothetical protein